MMITEAIREWIRRRKLEAIARAEMRRLQELEIERRRIEAAGIEARIRIAQRKTAESLIRQIDRTLEESGIDGR